MGQLLNPDEDRARFRAMTAPALQHAIDDALESSETEILWALLAEVKRRGTSVEIVI
ncbi:hypothetical protein [Sphingomonas morindae]|uniref:Transcriptional regulator n=1 Tax=Sphingomonas morindae TaxID=1541170 RepID=A0ABY4XDL9_9SPHN|nr:hypothetical protein [Sphingomonas morindae]USI74943.1 hypothetical protein LHA26_17385 [Sphingomonas morindae]